MIWTLPRIDDALQQAAATLRAEELAARTDATAIDRARRLVDRLLDHRLSLMPPAVADLEAAE